MSERKVEGVTVRETGHKKWAFDYGPGDMEAVYHRGQWHSWQDIISWLEKYGERDNELTPGETVALAEDVRSLLSSGGAFTSDWKQAYQMAHKYRQENNQKFAKQHAQATEQAKAMAR